MSEEPFEHGVLRKRIQQLLAAGTGGVILVSSAVTATGLCTAAEESDSRPGLAIKVKEAVKAIATPSEPQPEAPEPQQWYNWYNAPWLNWGNWPNWGNWGNWYNY